MLILVWNRLWSVNVFLTQPNMVQHQQSNTILCQFHLPLIIRSLQDQSDYVSSHLVLCFQNGNYPIHWLPHKNAMVLILWYVTWLSFLNTQKELNKSTFQLALTIKNAQNAVPVHSLHHLSILMTQKCSLRVIFKIASCMQWRQAI